MSCVSSIDGALLFCPHGLCYGIGVILDGAFSFVLFGRCNCITDWQVWPPLLAVVHAELDTTPPCGIGRLPSPKRRDVSW